MAEGGLVGWIGLVGLGLQMVVAALARARVWDGVAFFVVDGGSHGVGVGAPLPAVAVPPGGLERRAGDVVRDRALLLGRGRVADARAAQSLAVPGRMVLVMALALLVMLVLGRGHAVVDDILVALLAVVDGVVVAIGGQVFF